MSPQLNLGASNSSRIKLYISLDFQSLNLMLIAPVCRISSVYSSLNMASCTVATNNITVFFVPYYFWSKLTQHNFFVSTNSSTCTAISITGRPISRLSFYPYYIGVIYILYCLIFFIWIYFRLSLLAPPMIKSWLRPLYRGRTTKDAKNKNMLKSSNFSTKPGKLVL